MKIVHNPVSLPPSSSATPPPQPIMPLLRASNSSHRYVRLPIILVPRSDASQSRYPWLAPQRQRLAPDSSVTTRITSLAFPCQQQEVINALLLLAERPEQLSSEQSAQLQAFSIGGGERLRQIAMNMDYHATFNQDFGYGHVDFYGMKADAQKTPYALKQAGFEPYQQNGRGSHYHATTLSFQCLPWSCLNGIVKKSPLRANIPLRASKRTWLTFFNRAEQHVKTSQDNEKIALAAIAKMLTGLLASRPQWFSGVTAEARENILSGADFPLLHAMMQLLPDKAPLLMRFTGNQYYEWRDGDFRSPSTGEVLRESAPAG